MITKVLLFNTEHEAAEALKKLQGDGLSAQSLAVLVSNVEHSRLLNAETDMHIDLLSEIASANRRDDDRLGLRDGASSADAGFGSGENKDEQGVDGVFGSFHLGTPYGLVAPMYAQQPSMQVPSAGVIGFAMGGPEEEQGVPSLMAYGLSEDNAHHCLQALRAGQCLVCVKEANDEVNDMALTQLGAVKVLDNQL